MNKTFFIHTIGCKLNQFDSECIRHALVARGWTCDPAGRQAAVHIINSCTVTAKSDARCRNAVRRVRRWSPGSFILVTGCYAETQPARLAAVSEIDLVLGNDRKADIPAVLDEIAGGACSGEALERCRRSKDRAPQEIDSFFGHSRAFIKIQDGCNASCSYCIVPRARGRSRSVAPQAILRQVDALAASGYGEIVLTGIHIGRYGADLDEPMTLAQLVALILERTRVQRLRLSSIELTEVTPELISLPRSTERVAPHFHIPLQSGDDTILRRMNRPYRAEQFRETIAAIAADIPGAAIGTDIIVGFPGEGERHFEKTLALVRDLPLSYFHVFAFSPRPFTAAAAMPCHVPPSEKKRRSRRTIDLGKEKRSAFEAAQIGSEQLAVVEGQHAEASFSRCLTGNYCEVLVPRGAAVRSLVRIHVTHSRGGMLYGTVPEAARAGTGATLRQ